MQELLDWMEYNKDDRQQRKVRHTLKDIEILHIHPGGNVSWIASASTLALPVVAINDGIFLFFLSCCLLS